MGELADTARRRLTSLPDPNLCPRWTTVVTRPPALELGADDVWVTPVAVLSDGDVITGNALGLVRQWRTDEPGVPAELGSQDSAVSAVAVLFDDRVVTGGGDGRVRLWRTDQPGVPVELVFGNGDWDEEVTAVAEISDGRLVTGHAGGSVRLRRNFYDATVELGTHVMRFTGA
jgi:WD40 repeat protein